MKKLTVLILVLVANGFLMAQVSNNALISTLKDSTKGANKKSGSIYNSGYQPGGILIFGNGGLRSSATSSNGSENPTNGSLGATFIISDKSELTVGYTINTFKTIKINTPDDFGNNLLIPDLGGRSFTLSGTHFFFNKIGAYAEFLVADSKWEIDSVTYETSPLSFKVGIAIAPFGNISTGDNFISLIFYAGYSNRSILGDLSNEEDIRAEFLGTTQKSFHGIEFGTSLLLNQTKVFVNVPLLFSKESINGLTGGQVVIGLTISGDLLKIN
jgi:hypothetical protein